MNETDETGRIVAIDVRPSNSPTVGQGIAERVRPRIIAKFADEGCAKDAAFVIMHPAVSFLHHYVQQPLQARGRAMLTLTSRHLNNDSSLLMERLIQDVGAGVRYLREAGYEGELRAVGDVLVDQLAYMRRCGFDAFDPDAPLDPQDVEAAFARWPEVYQSAADARTPIWSKRHA